MSIDWDATIATIRAGWLKGDFGSDEKGGRCIVGALREGVDWEHSLRDRRLVDGACDTVLDVAREQFPERLFGGYPHDIVGFNDDPRTTRDDVILVLEKARAHETI